MPPKIEGQEGVTKFYDSMKNLLEFLDDFSVANRYFSFFKPVLETVQLRSEFIP